MTILIRSQPEQSLISLINWNDANIGTGVKIGSIPATAYILPMTVYVTTAFNAGGANNVLIGFAAGNQEVAQSSDVAANVAGFKTIWRAVTLNPQAGVRDVWVRFTQTGAAATAGQLWLYIPWRL